MIDQNRKPARFILLGSASTDLIRDSSESLAGRIFYKELCPFHLLELPEHAEQKLMLRGGYPNAFLAKSDKMSELWREGFIQTYVERDLPLLGLPLAPGESRRLLRMLSHLHGQILNYSMLSKALGLSSPTVKKYIMFLEQAFLLYLLEPYSGNTGKRIIKSPKLYIRDSGMLNTLMGIRTYNDLLSNPAAGAIWEGFVLMQIKTVLPYNTDICFYRTNHGAELDVVLTFPQGLRIGVEIKFSSSPTLSRGNFEAMRDLDIKQFYVIAPVDDSFMLKENVHVMGITRFVKMLKEQA
jgi:predicted AAA+ superfamily ATPase